MRNGPATCGKNDCAECKLDSKIMCRYGRGDSVLFLAVLLPFFVLSITGVIKAGLGVWLWGWLAYSLIFFFVIEPIILCRYCPYWGMEGVQLKCHANYGVLKFYKYKPEPAPRIAQIMFIITALASMVIPLVLLFIGKEYLLFSIGTVMVICAIIIAKHTICTKCINFSCPMNSMDEELRRKYFEKNDELRKGYENKK